VSPKARTRWSEFEPQRIFDYLNSNDDLTLVVRSHIAMEATLNRVLDASLDGGLTTELEQLRFMQRVDLVIGLGRIDADTRPMFLWVNKLRNNYSHSLDAKLTKRQASEAVRLIRDQGADPLDYADELVDSDGPTKAIAWAMATLWFTLYNQGVLGASPSKRLTRPVTDEVARR
jgi:hypothetical protein